MSPTRPNLDAYRKKRDPRRTPEPFGDEAGKEPPGEAVTGPSGDDTVKEASGAEAAKVPSGKTSARRSGATAPAPALGSGEAPSVSGHAAVLPRFVVQKHWATNMHFDLRLELDGTLKSWAVPKGPSTQVEEKRLAVHVEDHPLEYADFEGVIPAGNYGAGSVIVWDRGGFGSFKPEDLLEQYERGKMELELFGFKLRGRWTLVRMGKKEKEWLLLKKDDGAASEREAIDRYPESVITGLTVEEMRDVPGTLAALRERVQSLGAPRRAVAARGLSLMLATLADRPPEGPDWCFEIKYDGVRVLAERDDDALRLFGRSGEEITARYPEIAAALRALPVRRVLLDGEIVAEDASGRPSFQRLQARMGLTRPRDIESAMRQVPVRAFFFDCLSLEGHDLRGLDLESRKELLGRVVPPLGTVQRCDHVLAHGHAFYEVASELGLEGIVAKKRASAYSGRRSPDWLKIKCQRRQEFVIGGYTEPQGSRARFGALHVGLYQGPKLVYATKVGTGFDEKELDRVARALEPLKRATSPFDVDSPKDRGSHWVEPRLVCEVRFTEWTREGGLRHPTYLGLRSDRKPEECRREEPVRLEVVAAADDAGAPLPTTRRGRKADAGAPAPAWTTAVAGPRPVVGPSAKPAREVRVSNIKKVFWPAEGYTKGDLIAYYDAVAPLMLPYLRDRPVVLTRYPDGINGKSFFQKDAPVFVPDWVRTEPIESDVRGRPNRYFVLDDAESLRYVANLGTIPIHAWSARAGSLDHPDWMVLDLDPKSAPFTQVVQVARVVKTILDELELPSYIKTSGASGLHVMVPMGRHYTHEETRTFARVLAMLVVDAVPEISTVTRTVHARGGKVYVDFGQNGHGITIASVYCVRPLPGAPASCPLRWDEVTARLDPSAFTIKTLPKRFESMPDPLAGVLGEGVDMARTLERIERRITDAGATGPAEAGGSEAEPAEGERPMPTRAKTARRKPKP